MAEYALVLDPAVGDRVMLCPLVAARDAPRVPLGLVHVRTTAIQFPLQLVFISGARRRAALRVLAVRRHRFSYRWKSKPFSAAYHVITE